MLICSRSTRRSDSHHRSAWMGPIGAGSFAIMTCAGGCAELPLSDAAPVETPTRCGVSGRLVDAGYLQPPFEELTEDDLAAALAALAEDVSLPPPASMVPKSDDPLWAEVLSRIGIKDSTLEACERAAAAAADVTLPPPAKPPPLSGATEPAPAGPPATTARPSATETASPPRRLELPLVDRTLKLGEGGFVLEELRCEGLAGAWLLLIEGDIVALDQDIVTVRAASRYALRFWPKEEGVDTTDWFCAPRRRFCYSEVAFTDWRGQLRPGQDFGGGTTSAFPTRIGIPLGVAPLIETRCTF